jgi:hypothetical protein
MVLLTFQVGITVLLIRTWWGIFVRILFKIFCYKISNKDFLIV